MFKNISKVTLKYFVILTLSAKFILLDALEKLKLSQIYDRFLYHDLLNFQQDFLGPFFKCYHLFFN